MRMMLHRHHIVPRHVGGGDGTTVVLTIAEHAEEHRKLWEMHHRWQDFVAWKALSGQINHQEAARIAMSNGGRIASALHVGMKRSTETRQKISKAKKGKPNLLDPEVYLRIAASNRGQQRTAETRSRMSESRRKSGHATHVGPLPEKWRERISAGRQRFVAQHLIERPCLECNHLFLASDSRAKFCSQKCKMREWRRQSRG